MIEVKQSFLEGLDLDTSFFNVRKDAYIDALNITRDAVAGGQDLAITNIIGNRNVTYNYPSGIGKVRGAIANTLRNTIIFVRWNENGYNGIYEYDNTTRTISKIFENLTDSGGDDIFPVDQYETISNINIYNRDEGDLLFLLDANGRPTVFNITDFKAGAYTPVTRDIIDVAKCPPLSPPDCVYGNDTGRRTNNLRNEIFRFKYRWIYDDNYKSTFSPISAVPLPVNILSTTYSNEITNNNVISLSVATGDKSVKAIEIAMSYVNKTNDWSDFQSVITLDKATGSIGDDTVYNYQFYNDSTYPTIDINESLLEFDRVPLMANAQEMPNGNVLTYAGILEGYNRDLSPNVTLTINTVAAGSGGTIGSLNATYKIINGVLSFRFLQITFSGIPAVGTVVTVKMLQVSGSVIVTAATYTTVSGDTSASVALGIQASATGLGILQPNSVSGSVFTGSYNNSVLNFSSIEITPPASSATFNSIPTWAFSTSRSLGLIYFDKKV